MAKEDFIFHVLHGTPEMGALQTMVIPKGTVLLQLRKVTSTVKAVPYKTTRDLQLTIRKRFIEELEWDALEEAETEDGQI